MKTFACMWLVLVLGTSAGLKAARAEVAAIALSTYGVTARRAQRAVLWALVSVELGLAGALAIGARWAPAAIAGLFAGFTVVTLAALLRGRAGQPCGCFGSGSRLAWSVPLRTAAIGLAAGAVALGWLSDAPPGYEHWLTVGLAVCLAAVLALGLAVASLARELAVMRLDQRGRGALEIAEEGPPLGAIQSWAAELPWRRSALFGLAIFTSEGCPLCRQSEPAVRHVADDPLVAVGIFDEVADAGVWAQAAVPGSPYAVAVDAGGVALSKGTFNGLAQLESVLATARTRSQEVLAVG